jgi:hypothetical protein
MASVEDVEILHCSCCGLKAVKKTWSCGCVTVAFDEDAYACSDCDSFSDQRESCGEPGHPGG